MTGSRVVFVALLGALGTAAGDDQLACAGSNCPAPGDADEFVTMQIAGTKVREMESAKVRLCLEAGTPEEAARKAGLAAKNAASRKHSEQIILAGSQAQEAKLAATSKRDSTISDARQTRVAAFTAAESTRQAYVAKALADAEEEEATTLANVENQRLADVAAAVAKTKHSQETINQKHAHMFYVNSEASQKAAQEYKAEALNEKSATQKDALAETKAAFDSTNAKHRSMLQEARATFEKGKAHADAQAKVTQQKLIRKALAVKVQMERVAQVTEKQAIADAENKHRTEIANAEANQSKMVAQAEGEAKTEHMKAWMDTMSTELACEE